LKKIIKYFILAGIEVDFTEMYAELVNLPVGKMRDVLQEKSVEFASTYAVMEATVNQKLAELYEKFE